MKITLENISHNNQHVHKKYPFLSKILFIDGRTTLCIIDNVHPKTMSIYAVEISEDSFKQQFLEYASEWYKSGHKIPISIFFEHKNIKPYVAELSKIVYIRTIVQIDGYIFAYPQFENITNRLTLEDI